MRIIIENLLTVDPNQRWDASFILGFAQEDFAVETQKAWRGHYQRRRFRMIKTGLVKIQGLARGYVTKKLYANVRVNRREDATIKI